MPKGKHRKAAKKVGERPTNVRKRRKVFLIICEGEQTEPNYFRSLAQDLRVNAQVEITGLGNDPRTLLHKAKEYLNRQGYDECWCVFDKDQISDNDFNNVVYAITQAPDMNAAWSNSCFELWFVLHYHNHQAASSPADYARILNSTMGTYAKTSSGHYETLKAQTDVAVSYAKGLLQMHASNPPAQCNPATTVFLLVQRLQTYSAELYDR